MEYLVNICPDQPPEEEMLPGELKEVIPTTEPVPQNQPSLQLLQLIAQANAQGLSIGRRSLAHKTGLTEGVVRGLVESLETEGYLIPNRGRRGLILTHTGKEMSSLFSSASSPF